MRNIISHGQTNSRNIMWSVGLLFIVMIGLHLLWLEWSGTHEHTRAVDGVIDMRGAEMEEKGPLKLDGEWIFYPQEFLRSSELETQQPSAKLIQVPGNWGNVFRQDREQAQSEYGYGTYRLLIQLEAGDRNKYGIYVPSIQSASRLYVNRELAASSGHPAEHEAEYTPYNLPLLVQAVPDEDGMIDLVLHVANYINPKNGGIENSLQFGYFEMMAKRQNLSSMMQGIVFVVYLLHAFYAFYLYMIGVRNKRLLYFAIVLLLVTVALAGNNERLLLQVLPISYSFDYILKGICLALGGYAMLRASVERGQSRTAHLTIRVVGIVCALLILSILLFPKWIMALNAGFPVFPIYTLLCTVLALGMGLRSGLGTLRHDVYAQLIVVALFNVILWEYVHITLNVSVIFYPIDLMVVIVCLTTIWFKRYRNMLNQTLELAERLRQQDRNKDEFLANTSHELRNPLHGILNMAQSVAERDHNRLSAQSVEELETMQSIGRRMNIMLGDLLDVMRLKESGIQPHQTPVQLHTLVAAMIDSLQFMLAGKPVRLVNEVPPGMPKITADENRLQQILYNLLHNAIKFTDAGVICVRAHADIDRVEIEVADTGIGIAESDLERIFASYEQGEDKHSQFGGFGLGLAICRKMAELHNGKLTASSTVGIGSRFCLLLPQPHGWLEATPLPAAQSEVASPQDDALAEVVAAQEAARHEAPVSTEEVPSGRMTILAVDDDPVNLRVLSSVLSSDRGFELTVVSRPSEVLDKLHKRTWDLVILDVMMPEMSGYTLTALIRERFSSSELPILLLTARSQPEDIETGLLSGANDYVSKPVNAIELRARVRMLAGFKRTVAEGLALKTALLQAQINPHFIMNTLNSIVALSDIDQIRMQGLVDEFSTYLRSHYNMHKNHERIFLDQELDLVRAYVNIQKERFEERLQVDLAVQQAVRIQLPPLLIQPLVENAVTHGVLPRRRGGHVRIEVICSERELAVTVSDDGAGMSDRCIQELLEGRNRNSLGLYITHMRLQQMYGVGLTIDSQVGEGTTVSFVIDHGMSGPSE